MRQIARKQNYSRGGFGYESANTGNPLRPAVQIGARKNTHHRFLE